MNKKGSLKLWIFIIVCILLIALVAYSDNKQSSKANDFCRDNGFSSFETRRSLFSEGYCIKIVDSVRVEREVVMCGTEHCFAEVEDGE